MYAYKQLQFHEMISPSNELHVLLCFSRCLRNLTLGAKAEIASGKRVTNLDPITKKALAALLTGNGTQPPVWVHHRLTLFFALFHYDIIIRRFILVSVSHRQDYFFIFLFSCNKVCFAASLPLQVASRYLSLFYPSPQWLSCQVCWSSL